MGLPGSDAAAAECERDDEEAVIPFCRAHGIAYVPFGPLAGGWLTGKYRRGETFPAGDVDGLLAAIERARSREPDRLSAARFATANRWETAFAAELADLEALVES